MLMRRSVNMNILLFILKPLLFAFLILAVFGLVYLRSSFVKLEYSLGDLENKKTDCMRERKMLIAERTSLLSFAKFESAHNELEQFVLPDRVKVIHVDRKRGHLPYKVSLEKRQLTDH